jgi:hypothetical protein
MEGQFSAFVVALDVPDLSLDSQEFSRTRSISRTLASPATNLSAPWDGLPIRPNRVTEQHSSQSLTKSANISEHQYSLSPPVREPNAELRNPKTDLAPTAYRSQHFCALFFLPGALLRSLGIDGETALDTSAKNKVQGTRNKLAFPNSTQ